MVTRIIDGNNANRLMLLEAEGGGELVIVRNSAQKVVFSQPSTPARSYLACIPGRQFVGSGAPKDLSDNALDGVLQTALTDANLWATDGYMTTAPLQYGAVALPVAKSTFNLATESVLFSVKLKKALPAASDPTFGNADTSTKNGFYLSCRATTGKVLPVLNTASGAVTVLTESTAVFCDNTDHVLTFAFDAVTKQAFLFRDGCLSNVYATGATGATTPVADFLLGGTPSSNAVAAQFSGVHLLKFAGGLPMNVNALAARLAARPHDYLTDADIVYA